MSQIEIITRAERYRRWSYSDRARILAECEMPGAIIEEVARRNDISPSLIHKWRKQLRDSAAERTAATFIDFGTVENLPLPPAAAPMPRESQPIGVAHLAANGCIEISFPGGECLTVRGEVSELALVGVINALRHRQC
ncbi:IS66-like element accessory protein TnpA [Sandaracinobacteroides hominis]|uniref:IS66-like element accessory protein TnpA n=1 Tax=Sandaracinobacteroides hominis TaxID=2780086 RepID=UPI0018F49856|nr:transposase [Sandaracinobacteroides hominis]